MFKFENVDPQGYAVSIDTYSLECIPDNTLPHDLKQKDEEDLMILDFLPMRKSVARVVTEYLVRMQNDIINHVNPREDRSISAYDVKPSHVITCVPEQDFLNIAISNIDHVLNNDGKEHTNYNFQTVERQLVDRFFMEKPLIDLMTIPLFEYRTGTTLRVFFSTVKDKLEPLSTNDWNCIMNDFRFLNEISAALSTLKIAIGFMKLSFPNPNQYLTNYLKRDLKLDDRVHTLSRPVLRSSRVKHIQSLWEVLSLRQSSLLIEMNQNPFFMIDDQEFHVHFSEEEKKKYMKILAGFSNINVLITELHYVIMNIRFKDISPDWGIMETFEAFDDKNEIDVKAVECLEPLRDLEMRYGIALWKLAVQMKKGIRGTR
ncbi:uncharacterized protein LOC125787055 [Astyanax mexicanus]|uniref:uncharacterized protein LOC125787055 n=1 Tax=Astyanax mexicanus TaxID=7994 RepID=UPI0020CB1E03|nr:uncharacterized protein LOC125787055 [Astyanax mexicanus]